MIFYARKARAVALSTRERIKTGAVFASLGHEVLSRRLDKATFGISISVMRQPSRRMTKLRGSIRASDALAPRWLLMLCFAFTLSPYAGAQVPASEGPILEVFVREDCPHCADAKQYLPTFASEHPWLRIVYRSVDTDPLAREDLVRHSKRAGIWPPGVPTFVIDDRVFVGFEDARRTGADLAALVAHRAPHGVSQPSSQQPAAAPSRSVETGWFGTLSVERFGLPLFTLAMGLLDGFNPCAMWVLLFLLSMLVHLRDRNRMAVIAGTFVLVSGAVYYAFMAAWLNVFLLVGFTAAVRWTLACAAFVIAAINIKDFFAFGRGFSLSIPDSAKPGLYARMRAILQTDSLLPAMMTVAALAVIVNLIEVLCTAGLPAIYTAVLAQHELSPLAHYGYLALYILGYMADDSLMVATAVIALSSRKLTERAGRWLKLLSGVVMLGLGFVMLMRPEWLT